MSTIDAKLEEIRTRLNEAEGRFLEQVTVEIFSMPGVSAAACFAGMWPAAFEDMRTLLAITDELRAEIERGQPPTYRCLKCNSKLFWSGEMGCIHRCLTCEALEAS